MGGPNVLNNCCPFSQEIWRQVTYNAVGKCQSGPLHFFRGSKAAQGEASLMKMLCCRYIEQVAVALHGNERAAETVQALLRSCRAKTVSSAAAMHQASTVYDTESCRDNLTLISALLYNIHCKCHCANALAAAA